MPAERVDDAPGQRDAGLAALDCATGSNCIVAPRQADESGEVFTLAADGRALGSHRMCRSESVIVTAAGLPEL